MAGTVDDPAEGAICVICVAPLTASWAPSPATLIAVHLMTLVRAAELRCLASKKTNCEAAPLFMINVARPALEKADPYLRIGMDRLIFIEANPDLVASAASATN